MSKITIPLSIEQIEAAKRLNRHLVQWIEADNAFSLLRDSLPGFSPEETLIKIATLNQLYYTNVYALGRMAKHISEIMKSPPADPYCFVDAIASLPPSLTQKIERKHWSFASKFAHFFVDSNIYHIYDSYAKWTVDYHLGEQERVAEGDNVYKKFVMNLVKLQSISQIHCTPRDIDIYFWLRGLYHKWRQERDKAQINVEVLDLFNRGAEGLQNDLKILEGVSGGSSDREKVQIKLSKYDLKDIKKQLADKYIDNPEEKETFLYKATQFKQWANYIAGLILTNRGHREFRPSDIEEILEEVLSGHFDKPGAKKSGLLTADVEINSPYHNGFPCLKRTDRGYYRFVGFLH